MDELYQARARSRKDQEVLKNPRLKEIIDLEPRAGDLLFLAACQRCQSERWVLYEVLKFVAGCLTWQSKNPAMQKFPYLDALVETIDILLPSAVVEEEDYEADNKLRPTAYKNLRKDVETTFPDIKLPPWRDEKLEEAELSRLVDDWFDE
jgi:hypothetical protein